MLTPLVAATAVVEIVLAAALALLALEYRGEEFVAAYSRILGLGVGPSDVGPAKPSVAADTVPARDAGPTGATDARSAGALELLRFTVGAIWLANLLFIVVPSAGYWSTFAAVAQSYAPTTLGGPWLADLVAAHPVVFSWLIALLTAYLAIAFLSGVTTRLACVLGGAASVLFLLTQFGSTFSFPGGTEVGAHPLYLVIYAALWVGGAGKAWALDGWLWRRGWGRRVPQARWFASPPPAAVFSRAPGAAHAAPTR